jgi:rhodanese-related sulfurtransferase
MPKARPTRASITAPRVRSRRRSVGALLSGALGAASAGAAGTLNSRMANTMQPDIWVFLQKNIFLVAVCLISGVMLMWPLIQRMTVGAGREVNAQQAVQLINRRDAVILDVRDAQEYASGHIANARHMPIADIGKRIAELDKVKQRPVIVACRTGARAGAACALLRKNGFQEVFALKGGILGWQQASLPLEK